INSAMKFSTEALEDGFRVTIEFEVKHWNDLVDQVYGALHQVALTSSIHSYACYTLHYPRGRHRVGAETECPECYPTCEAHA
ncbi:unnamed protein product, partial [marine sediment metagenome]